MFQTNPQRKTARTGLRSISGSHVNDLDPHACRFVLDKLSQLIKRPTVQARAEFFARFDPFSDVLAIFHHYRRTALSLSLQDDLFGNKVIDVPDVSLFSARDFPQPLFCGLRTVALKAFPSSRCKERKHFPFQRIGPLVKVDRTAIFKQDLPGASQGLQTGCCFGNGIATHLRADLGKALSQQTIAKVMQPNFETPSKERQFLPALKGRVSLPSIG